MKKQIENLSVRFYEDPETGLPHIFGHNVTEEEVWEVLKNVGEDRSGYDETRYLIGQTDSGRFLRLIYRKFSEEILIITAYDVKGKDLHAFKRRRKKK